MKKLIIHYQTNRLPNNDDIHYPEDNRTPAQRVDYIEELSKKWDKEEIIVTSACPYCIEGFIKFFKKIHYDIEMFFFIDNVSCEANDIFHLLAVPMQRMIFI